MLTKTKLFALVAGPAIALAALVPMAAQAAALTPTQISAITNLLEAFGADQSVIANVNAVLNGSAPAASTAAGQTDNTASSSASANVGCASLSGTLGFGSEGEDVSSLQSFLSKDSSIYPEGLVTGLFGHATEDAVRRWQAAHDVVASGTPEMTGYGLVGPSTRGRMNQEMEMECEHGDHGDATASSTASSTESRSSESGD